MTSTCHVSNLAERWAIAHGEGDAVDRRAEALFQRSAYLPLRSLRCDYGGEVLTIRGEVPTYYLKQMAVELVRQVAGGAAIEVCVEVRPPGFRRVQPVDIASRPTGNGLTLPVESARMSSTVPR